MSFIFYGQPTILVADCSDPPPDVTDDAWSLLYPIVPDDPSDLSDTVEGET